MGVYLRNRTYWFKRQIGNRVYRRSLDIRKGQELLLSKAVENMDTEITALALGIPYRRPTSVPFDAYVDRYIKQEENATSRAQWLKKKQRLAHVAEVWRSTPLHEIDREAVLRLEKHLLEERKVAESTCNRYFEIVRHLFRRAIEDGNLRENPVSKFYQSFREETTRRALSAEEISRVMAAAAKVQRDQRSPFHRYFYDLCLFALHTGARLGECLAMRIEHVRGDVAYLPIEMTKSRRRAPHKQTARIKPIILDDVARQVVERLSAGRSAGYVFQNKRRHVNIVYYAVKRVRALAKVPDFMFHQLRHTYITLASEKFGVSTARNIVSHADLKTTSRYTHPELAKIKESVTILGTTLPGYDDGKVNEIKEKG